MDTGVPQSVYSLDKTSLTEIESQSLRIGETMRLPDGAGWVTFDGVAHRLDVIEVEMPPLRARGADVGTRVNLERAAAITAA